MKSKPIVFALILILAAVTASGKTSTNTLYFGSTGFTVSDGINILSEGIFVVGFRSMVSPKDTGFYYGSDLSLGIPFTLYYFDYNYGFTTMFIEDDLFMGLKIPLGYRWPGTGGSMGFYLGGGFHW